MASCPVTAHAAQAETEKLEENIPPRGAAVVVAGLASKPELNGRTGRVLGQTEAQCQSGRVAVQLDPLPLGASGGSTELQQLSVRPRNLRMASSSSGSARSLPQQVVSEEERVLASAVKELEMRTDTVCSKFVARWRAGFRGGETNVEEHFARAWAKMGTSLRTEAIENSVGATIEEAGPKLQSQVKKILVEIQAEDSFAEDSSQMLGLLATVAEGTQSNSFVRNLVESSGQYPFKLDVLQGKEDEHERLLDYFDIVYRFGTALFAQQLLDHVFDLFSEP